MTEDIPAVERRRRSSSAHSKKTKGSGSRSKRSSGGSRRSKTPAPSKTEPVELQVHPNGTSMIQLELRDGKFQPVDSEDEKSFKSVGFVCTCVGCFVVE